MSDTLFKTNEKREMIFRLAENGTEIYSVDI